MSHENLTGIIIKYLLVVIFIASLVYFSFLVFNLIVILAVSILISFILKPLVKYLEYLKIQKSYAVLIVVVSAIALIGFSVYYFIPIISSQFDSILTQLKALKLQEFLTKIERDIRKVFPTIKPGELSHRIDSLVQSSLETFFSELSNIVTEIISILAFLIIVPFVTFFILKDGRELKLGVINLLPNRYYEMAYQVIDKVDKEIGKFVRGWILDATFVGVMATIGLYFLGIDNFAMIGLVAGIGHLIPYFGPIIGGVPALLVSVYQFGNFSMFLPIVILFTLIYTIDNGFVQPYVFSKSVNMHPVVIIFLILVGSELLGIVGMLLAVPVANVIRVAATELYHGYKNYTIVRL